MFNGQHGSVGKARSPAARLLYRTRPRALALLALDPLAPVPGAGGCGPPAAAHRHAAAVDCFRRCFLPGGSGVALCWRSNHAVEHN